MSEFTDTVLFRFRLLVGSILIIAGLLLLPFMLSAIFTNPKVHAEKRSGLDDNPNIITNGMVAAAGGVGQITNSAAEAAQKSLTSVTESIGSASVATGKFMGSNIYSGGMFVANGIGGSFSFTVRATGNVFGSIANTPIVSTIIRPADNVTLPVIEPAVLAAVPAEPVVTEQPAALPVNDSTGSWPMQGEITTRYGVPHRPFQPYHTGIDISDGHRSGVTPIKAFKSGKVADTVHSRVGLGNYVIVDHGGGLTSVYAHLHSISVQIGQEVDKTTTLGLEGSTGASTGTHLHFEIRLNGKPVDPAPYLNGQA